MYFMVRVIKNYDRHHGEGTKTKFISRIKKDKKRV